MNLPGLNFDLGSDLDMLRDAVRDFAQNEIAPRAAAIDETDQFPMELWRKFGDLGLLGITVHEDYGGSSLGYLAPHDRHGRNFARQCISSAFLWCPFQLVRQPDSP